MNVLIPFDVNPVSKRAVQTAIEMFSGNEDVHITAVHFSRGEDQPAEIAATEIESMGAESDVTVTAEIQVVEEGLDSRSDIRTATSDIIDTEDIELVVLGYEEKSLFDQLLQTDTKERVLETHGIPVLLVP